jgi:hypothetical protein
MLSPEIVAREAAKTLDLLRFALDRRGVDARAYAISADPAGLGPVDDQLCLTGGEEWLISYVERGVQRDIARFPQAYDAARHFFMALTDPKSFYEYRPAWEKETGQEFSMIA